MAKDTQPTYTAYANPYLACVECAARAVGRLDDDTLANWPCGHLAEVASLCPTWNQVDSCTCEDPSTHGLPTEGVRDRKGQRRPSVPVDPPSSVG